MACGHREEPFLSTLEAGKGFPIYTTYAAAPERSSFILDEGYIFQYDTDSLGADFITDSGGDIAMGFRLGDRWVYRVQDMYRPPVITASYPDMVRYYFYPFADVRVDAWFVVHSSTLALLDIRISHFGNSPIDLEVYPFMRSGLRPFQQIRLRPDSNLMIFEHQEYPDNWTLDHQVPYTDSIKNVWLSSGTPAAVCSFTSETGEPLRLPTVVDYQKKITFQVNGRAYLPGKERIPDAQSRLRLQLSVDGDASRLLTDQSPVWGGSSLTIDAGGFFRLETAILKNRPNTFTLQGVDLVTGFTGRVTGQLSAPTQRYDLKLTPGVPIPVIAQVELQNETVGHVKLRWQAAKGGDTYAIYKRRYPSPYYDRLVAGLIDTEFVDTEAVAGQTYGYIVVPVDTHGQLGIHGPEVSTIAKTVFTDFLHENDQLPQASSQPYARVLAFKHNVHLKGRESQQLRFIRGVAPVNALTDSLVRVAQELMVSSLEPYQSANERFFARTPKPDFGDPKMDALYWSAVNMMRQVFYPPEGKSSYNYYVFSREPTWGWGHGGQVFHESIAMLAYAEIDPIGAMNSQRVYRERQYSNGYINYRTGGYLDEIIAYNGQLTTSAPWYAWLNWEIFRLTRDTAFLTEMYDSSKQLYRFIVNNRDSDGDGLCEWGGHAVLESVRDALVAVWDEVGFPTAFESLDLNCMLVKEAKSLELMAETLGLDAEAAVWRNEHQRRTALINETFWDEVNGFYYQVDKNTHSFTHKTENDLKRDEIIGFLPLWAGVADEYRAARLVERLTDTARFWRAYGVPSLSAQDSYYNDKGYWNGPVWVQWNYLIMQGLLDYGYHEEARDLVDRVANGMIAVLRETHNLWEFYSPDQPWGGYHKTYIWAGIINRMMMDVRR